MNLEKYNPSPTVQKIYEHYEASRYNGHRAHLGGSQIGNPCSRALWYQFRHASSQSFEGRMLRLFETGDREEERIVANLRAKLLSFIVLNSSVCVSLLSGKPIPMPSSDRAK